MNISKLTKQELALLRMLMLRADNEIKSDWGIDFQILMDKITVQLNNK